MDHFQVEKHGFHNFRRWTPQRLSLSAPVGIAILSRHENDDVSRCKGMRIRKVHLSPHHQQIKHVDAGAASLPTELNVCLQLSGVEVLLGERHVNRGGERHSILTYTERRGGVYQCDWMLRFPSVAEYKRAVKSLKRLVRHAWIRRERQRQLGDVRVAVAAQAVDGVVVPEESPVEYGEASYIPAAES